MPGERTSPDMAMKASACAGTGVTGKLTLPPAPTLVVDVDDGGGGTVVVGDAVEAGL